MGHHSEHLARLRERMLADLRWHWGEAYCITWADGMYRAARRDTAAAFSCDSADGLRELIRHDYERKPVPRDLAASATAGSGTQGSPRSFPPSLESTSESSE